MPATERHGDGGKPILRLKTAKEVPSYIIRMGYCLLF